MGERLAHAYLFTGVEGIGKRTLALEFAQAINCEAPKKPGEPCGECRSCRLFAAGRHPDLTILAPDAGGKILIDSIRSLIQGISLKPLEARRRIALLTDFQAALPSAANALLKTLEEPPPATILLMAADSPDNLLPTIVSRCRGIALRPLPVADVSATLGERWHLPAERAALLARLSGGRMGWAVAQIEDEESAGERDSRFDEWNRTLRGSRAERFAIAQKLADERETIRDVLQTWESLSQDLLLLTLSPGAQITNIDRAGRLAELAKTVTSRGAETWLNSLRRVEAQIEHNANLRLALEAALLDGPRV